MRRSFIVLCFTLTVVAVFAAGCTESAEDAVCSDADDFKASVSKLVDDVKAGNFGDAQDQVSEVESSFEALESSAKDLASSKKESVQDDLDSVKGTLGELDSASSLSEIEDTLGQAESELKNAADSITEKLSC